MSKQIDLIRNADCQKRPNLYYVIVIGCSYLGKLMHTITEFVCVGEIVTHA